jgi:hypothetical protein
MSEQSSAIAGATEPVSNVSVEEYITRRIGSTSDQEEPSEESEVESEVEVEDQEAESEDQFEDDISDESEELSDESEIDLLNLTTEQIQDLAKKGKSRLLQRIGELTAQKKSLEEKLNQQVSSAPVKEVPQHENPFRTITDAKELSEKYAELEKVLEDTDSILEEYDDYANDDIIVIGDREFSKKDIKKANRNAREGMTKYLPAQEKQLQKVQHLVAMEQHYSEAAKKEIPEIQDEKSKVGAQFAAMMNDPLVGQVRNQIPELGAQIEYILAHAANSIFGGTLKAGASQMGCKLKASPPSSPIGSGTIKSGKQSERKAADAYNKFEQTHSVDDWVSARIAKYK